MITKEKALEILEVYKNAWINQDPKLILSIFHEDGEYGEYLLKGAFKGHDEIKKYWIEKVVEEQSNIEFKLLNLFTDNDTIIAEWDVTFYSSIENKRIHLVQIGVFETENDKIKRFREYWHSERL